MKAMTEQRTTSMSAITHSHLYLAPTFHPAGLETSRRGAKRCQIGMAKAPVEADDADGDDGEEGDRHGGTVDVDRDQCRRRQDDADHRGQDDARHRHPRALSRDQCLWPGTATSRLKAKSMREQLVMHAMVQKNGRASR